MKIKLILLLVFLLTPVLLVPTLLLSQSTNSDASITTQCWSKEDCDGVKGSWEPSGKVQWDEKLGRYVTCESGKGACYAINKEIKLQIPLPIAGGLQRTVSGFAEYLSVFYKFFVAAIAVMAVVLIMWGGFKGIYKAGSAEGIKDANETIFGAIAGLVIALLSYSLLNLINPKLVQLPELRIPKIKTESFGNWCPKNTKVLEYTLDGSGNVISSKETTVAKCPNIDNPPKYTYPNGGACTGQVCDGVDALCYYPTEVSASPICGNFIAHGHINWSGNAFIDDYIGLASICQDNKLFVTQVKRVNGDFEKVATKLNEHASVFTLGEGFFPIINIGLENKECGGVPPRGYVIVIEVNDDRFGQQCDDVYALGKSSITKEACVLISTQIIDKIDWSKIPNEILFQKNDFPLAPPGLQRDNGTQYLSCEINISRTSFPASNNNQWEDIFGFGIKICT